MINWTAFDWPTFGALSQALSGLFVGIAAVVGAVKVGLKQSAIAARQADITERQTLIMEKQVDLDSKNLAHQLYERRFAMYQSAADFLVTSTPSTCVEVDRESQMTFLKSMMECRFLFPPTVFEQMRELNFNIEKTIAIRHRLKENKYEFSDSRDQDIELVKAQTAWLSRRITTLIDVFPQLILT